MIGGLQKVTLLDFPNKVACTVFLTGCNLRCPYCHNPELVFPQNDRKTVSENELFEFLSSRRGKLDGVCITGGEPTLQRDLPEFLRKIKALGFAVKLDTNGTNPAMLRAILSEKLADYVAMDIKAGRENYSAVTGTLRPGLAAVEECARMLMDGDTDFEFRTTVVRGLHSAEDFADIAAWLPGNEKYFLQAFKDSGDVISGGCAAFTREEMESFRAILLPAIPNAEIRGMD